MHSRNPEIIKYAELIGRTPSALAMKLTNIASLDPEITSTGRKGLAGVSHADRSMWEEMQSRWESFAIETQRAESSLRANKGIQADVDDKSILERGVDYTGSNKIIQSTVRVGQNFFRRSVLSAYNYRCCITGLDIPRLLVASHIVPWRVDKENRLNPRNGLCLSVLHDKAFDLGILTIAENMTLRVSRKHTSNAGPFFNGAILAYDGKSISLPEKFHP
ncbi:MAG: HNH endonuclease, partial [Nitrospinales bacterium]